MRAYLSPGGVDGRTTWETPPALFAALDAEFGFVCDVAASAENAKCARFFSEAEDGLAQPWPRAACWLNPPYGRKAGAWILKARDEARQGSTVVCLVPVRSSTVWWHEAAPDATEVRLMLGRLAFAGGKRHAPFPSAILVFTPAGGPPTLKHVDLPRGWR